jgi:disulfide oxidoreductase YuzD
MTAVEWLKNELFTKHSLTQQIIDTFEQALEMEKEQIENAFNNGINSEDFFYPPFEISESEKYYNETYKPST